MESVGLSKNLIAKYEAKPGSDEPVNHPIMRAMIKRMEIEGLPYEKEFLDGLSLMPLLKEAGDLERDALIPYAEGVHHFQAMRSNRAHPPE